MPDPCKSDFQRFCNGVKYDPTFNELFSKYMDEEGWNASIFRERTHMCSNYFSQWKNDFQRQPQLKSVVTICIALRLDPDSSNELLWSAGYRLRTDIKTHMLYAYLILKSYERGEEIKQEPDAIRRSRLITDEGKSLIT